MTFVSKARLIAPVLALIVTSTPPLRAQGANSPRIRDSAGVRIVENPSRMKAPVVFKLGATPILDVGGLEDVTANEFDSKQGYLRGVLLSDGGLAAIDVNRVHYFDATGKRLKISGREGRGPGEFLYATAICRTGGDTIVIGDGRNSRSAILDGKGTFVRNNVEGENGSSPFDGCFDDGTYLLLKSVPGPQNGPRTLRLTRVRLEGTVVGVVGEFDSGVFDMATGRETSVAAAGNRLFFANALTSEIRVLSPDGKLTSIIRSDDPLVAITDAQLEERWSRTIPNNVSADERRSRMDRMRSMPHASTWPAHGRIHVDPAGRLWVQDFNSNRAIPAVWTAFDDAGRIIGRLSMPAIPAGERPLQVIGFGKDRLLVRRRDGDGADHLTAYPILRAP